MLSFLIEKEFKQLSRNKIIPRMLVALPLMAMLVFPWAANQEIKTSVWMWLTTTIVRCRKGLWQRLEARPISTSPEPRIPTWTLYAKSIPMRLT